MNNLNTIEQLVPVFTGTIGGKQEQMCDARALHSYLQVGRDFSSWLKERIEKFGFEENQDFALIPQIGGINNGKGGDRRSKDYHLTIGMAKELGMVENNDKGREIRRYFIAMEKKALDAESNAATIQQDNPAALRTLADASNTLASAANALADIARALAAQYEPGIASPNIT